MRVGQLPLELGASIVGLRELVLDRLESILARGVGEALQLEPLRQLLAGQVQLAGVSADSLELAVTLGDGLGALFELASLLFDRARTLFELSVALADGTSAVVELASALIDRPRQLCELAMSLVETGLELVAAGVKLLHPGLQLLYLQL